MIKVILIFLVAVAGIYILFRGNKNQDSTNKTKKKTMELTKQDFLERVVNYEKNPNEWVFLGDKPALVDFYAGWCAPCKVLSPILDEIAEEYYGSIDVYKVNTETEEELASVFHVRSIPTLLFIPKEGAPQIVNGALPKHQIMELVERVLLAR